MLLSDILSPVKYIRKDFLLAFSYGALKMDSGNRLALYAVLKNIAERESYYMASSGLPAFNDDRISIKLGEVEKDGVLTLIPMFAENRNITDLILKISGYLKHTYGKNFKILSKMFANTATLDISINGFCFQIRIIINLERALRRA